MSIYVNFDHLIDYLRKVRKNRGVNISPYMGNALLNVQQMLELDVYNPILFDYVEVGNCDGCVCGRAYGIRDVHVAVEIDS